MKPSALAWLVCPRCGADLQISEPPPQGHEGVEVETGTLCCSGGHRFPVREGVPCLRVMDEISGVETTHRTPASEISESFSEEWKHFDYHAGRTWHATLEERRSLFLDEMGVAPPDLKGKVVLDAGCGNGTLSEGIASYGCQVVAVDVSHSVFFASRFFRDKGTGRTHFVRGEILNIPVRPGSVDYVYSSGVLHHNPDTFAAFESVLPALRPGGKIYIWVYHKEPGLKFRLQLLLRRAIAPLPMPAKRVFVYIWSSQSMARQALRRLLGSTSPEDDLSWRERVVDLMDIYTPRYRWMHTQEEVHGWYRELGLRDIQTSEIRDWGFGVVGRKPS